MTRFPRWGQRIRDNAAPETRPGFDGVVGFSKHGEPASVTPSGWLWPIARGVITCLWFLSFASPALGECCHSHLARLGIAVRGRAIFVVSEG
jgi:hypothetical protein